MNNYQDSSATEAGSREDEQVETPVATKELVKAFAQAIVLLVVLCTVASLVMHFFL